MIQVSNDLPGIKTGKYLSEGNIGSYQVSGDPLSRKFTLRIVKEGSRQMSHLDSLPLMNEDNVQCMTEVFF